MEHIFFCIGIWNSRVHYLSLGLKALFHFRIPVFPSCTEQMTSAVTGRDFHFAWQFVYMSSEVVD
jgi:hypothetical protein